MVVTVYLDGLFLLGGAVDYGLLLICAKFANAHIRKTRSMIGAVLGGLYSVLTVVCCNTVASALFVKITVSLLVVLISFGAGTPGRFLRVWSTYLVSNFAFIGFALAVEVVRGGIPFAIRFSSLVISAVFYYGAVSLLLKRMMRARDRDAEVKIEFRGRTCQLHALVDTGNFAKDPIGHSSVIVAELTALKCLFDAKTYSAFAETNPQNYPYLLETLEFAECIRLIPYRTVGTESALMIAFRPDRVAINGKTAENTLIAFSPHRLSACGEFEALVGVGEDGI